MNIDFFEDGFRIVCFMAFVLVLVRECNKKIIPQLHELYQRYKKNFADKVNLREKINRQKKEVLEHIEAQRVEGVRLTEKISVWAKKEHSLMDYKMQEVHDSKEKLRQYMAEQSRFLSVTDARKEFMPEIFSKVTEEIYTLYSRDVEQEKYTTKILTALESDKNG